MDQFPTKQEILEAYERIQPFISKTPILQSSYINSRISAEFPSTILFKCQNLQKTGAFKVRGAANKISQLNNVKNICAHSSGNHAQAVAYVGKKLGLNVRIVMPIDTPEVKKNAVKGYGALIHECGPTMKNQEDKVEEVSKQYNATKIHPYNDYKIIAGAASVGYQIYQEYSDLDYIVFPIGGGGLTSGTLLSTRYFSPKTKTIGVQPYLARDALLSIKQNKIMPPFPPKTIAEGVRTGIGSITFKVMKEFIDDIILVEEEQIIQASKLFMQRMKIVVEFSGAMVLAAILKDKRFIGKKVCAIISGGNIDLTKFFEQKKKTIFRQQPKL